MGISLVRAEDERMEEQNKRRIKEEERERSRGKRSRERGEEARVGVSFIATANPLFFLR